MNEFLYLSTNPQKCTVQTLLQKHTYNIWFFPHIGKTQEMHLAGTDGPLRRGFLNIWHELGHIWVSMHGQATWLTGRSQNLSHQPGLKNAGACFWRGTKINKSDATHARASSLLQRASDLFSLRLPRRLQWVWQPTCVHSKVQLKRSPPRPRSPAGFPPQPQPEPFTHCSWCRHRRDAFAKPPITTLILPTWCHLPQTQGS